MALAWLLAALAGHAALCVELVNRTHGTIANRWADKASTALSGIALVGIPCFAAATWAESGGSGRGDWLGWYAGACALFAPAWITMRAALKADPQRDRSATADAQTIDLGRRLGEAATGSPIVRKLSALPGNQLLRLRIERRTLSLPRLPTELEGLRVAHLTDLHMSPRMGIAYYQEVVRLANEFEPDLVCLTGDIVECTPQLDWVEPVLGPLRSRQGSFFVLGNHDLRVDASELRRRLERVGLRDVSRECAPLGSEGGRVVVSGDERPWSRRWSTPPGDTTFTIALLHTPDRFAWAVAGSVDLALAGHTHGGQVCFPLLGPLLCPSRHGVRYASGTFRHGGTALHVSRGTGSLFPLRYACPPELGLFTLRGQSDGAHG